MGHDHAHGAGSAASTHRGRLVLVLAITASFMVIEAIAGVITGSLVLLADAGHMLTDVAGLSIALAAIWIARRPPNARKTYGYYRAEILGALLNAMLLIAVAAYILYEAFERFQDPPDVASTPLLVVASLGLIVNVVSAWLLLQGSKESLNMRGAFLEVIGDLLGSVGAIAAGLVILTTGWSYADPLFAVAVALFILPRTWMLLKSALDILFEGTPEHIELEAVQAELLAEPGVQSVHDLHVWTVTSGFVALSGHVLVADGVAADPLLVSMRQRLADRFDIAHVTIQVENERLSAQLEQPCFPESNAVAAGH